MTTFYLEYQKIFVSVDCIIFGFDANKLKVLIGKRQMDPGRGEWSDHREMADRARKLMKEKIKTNPSWFHPAPPVVHLLTQLQRLYEAVNGETLDKRNFRKASRKWISSRISSSSTK